MNDLPSTYCPSPHQVEFPISISVRETFQQRSLRLLPFRHQPYLTYFLYRWRPTSAYSMCRYLLTLADHIHSCRFGTFLFDSDLERVRAITHLTTLCTLYIAFFPPPPSSSLSLFTSCSKHICVHLHRQRWTQSVVTIIDREPLNSISTSMRRRHHHYNDYCCCT